MHVPNGMSVSVITKRQQITAVRHMLQAATQHIITKVCRTEAVICILAG